MVEMVGGEEKGMEDKEEQRRWTRILLLASRAELLETGYLTLTPVNLGCSSGVLRGVSCIIFL